MSAADRELDAALETLVRAAGADAMDVDDPGIPGGANQWFPSQGQARKAALRAAAAKGPGHRVVHNEAHAQGQLPHFHIVNARGQRVDNNHYFYGRRPPRKAPRSWAREAESFVIQTPMFGIPEGHERLTRDATAGLAGIGPADLPVLVEGSRRVDYGPVNHILPAEQRRHFLRRSLCQSLSAAVSEARNTLVALHARALQGFARGNRADAFGWAGEAIHLIQDSYSDAHTQRDWAVLNLPIIYIRYFGAFGDPPPREHGVIPAPDPRDQIAPHGFLIREARAAIATSREYLALLVRHAAGTPGTTISRELTAFMNRHFALSPARTEPRSFYLRCRII